MARSRRREQQEVRKWVWQPFGPSDDLHNFSLPGYHYRGYPAPVYDALAGVADRGAAFLAVARTQQVMAWPD